MGFAFRVTQPVDPTGVLSIQINVGSLLEKKSVQGLNILMRPATLACRAIHNVVHLWKVKKAAEVLVLICVQLAKRPDLGRCALKRARHPA